ncbi:hypothetical protein HG536_0F03850 [Torulaspora globosa]|uniref:Glutathione synthetase n=1 Tax=Torulaspora globosa TaxID=48254 RepID=A0A7G3ZKM4_9SACH|nr:uncharacterized protein HG536_0F03850 [Torulaspora globosa]QLL34060.1 hypothetical protein HG536_0F03850 [Torulaspora globosa]
MDLSYPNLSETEIKEEILSEVHQWALANGLVMYPPAFSSEQATIVPTTLYPTYLPRSSFEKVVSLQKTYNKLYADISRDSSGGWLTQESIKLAKYDNEFTGKLWELYLKAKKQGIAQKLRLGIFRSDYLIDKRTNEAKQVEFNTISVSFGASSTKVGELHDFLNKAGKYSANSGDRFYQSEIPVSDSTPLLAKGLAIAAESYQGLSERKVVAFIVQDNERNAFDQRTIEFQLLKAHCIKSVRITLGDLHNRTTLDPESKRLFVKKTGEEIAVVYFRAGYSPSEYKSERDWENRLLLETSYAIKAPDILTHLSGTKKIQQLLTDEDILAKFIPDVIVRKQMLSTFVKIYPLDDSALGQEGKKLAFKSPSKFVLKPQREGGGNNVYKQDIPLFLEKLDEKDWSAYILMELIEPNETTENVVVRGNSFFREPIISELGIFGCILFDDTDVHLNEYSGWLLRSKFSGSNEGGVAAGFGCVDSVMLY